MKRRSVSQVPRPSLPLPRQLGLRTVHLPRAILSVQRVVDALFLGWVAGVSRACHGSSSSDRSKAGASSPHSKRFADTIAHWLSRSVWTARGLPPLSLGHRHQCARESLVLCLLLATTAAAQLPVPQLKSVYPAGARLGSTQTVEVAGANLEETTRLYFSHGGLSAQPLPDEKGKPKRFQVIIATNVPVGDYDIRTIGKHGISNPRTFVVGDLPELLEQEPNDARTNATHLSLNSTINGRINPAEDVDWFVFSAQPGQRVLIECRAWRIDSRLDGFLWLYDRRGRQLAVSQDEDIRDEKRDPFIDFEVPAEGEYYLKLTDFTYGGNEEHFYRLSVSTSPYLDYVLPTGIRAGTNELVTVFGRNLPGGVKTDLTMHGRPLEKVAQPISIPADAEAATSLRFTELIRPPASRLDGAEIRVTGPAGRSNAKLLVFSRAPEGLEAEPNDRTNQAQRLTVPAAVSGQFIAPQDVDYFVFQAKKDEKIGIDVLAERLGSPADPDLEILDATGKVLVNPQDDGDNIGQIRFTSNSRDIYHAFTAPAAGDYYLRLEHLYRQVQGGPQYIYRLELQRDPQPDFRLICQPAHEIAIDTHVVYQGGRQRLDILVWRLYGHNDPIVVQATHLPPGITSEPIVIGPGLKWGTLVLTGAAEAPMGEAEVQIVGTSLIRGETLARHARGGVIVWDTVNTPALSRMTRSIMLAVREKVAFALTASPGEVVVTKGDRVHLTLALKRREDMPNAVQLTGAGYQLPPGLEIPATTIEAGRTDAMLDLKTDNVAEGTFSFIVNGEAQVPVAKDKNIRCLYPSNPIKLTIRAKPAK